MKRLICILLAVMMVIALAACGGDKPDGNKETSGKAVTGTKIFLGKICTSNSPGTMTFGF